MEALEVMAMNRPDPRFEWMSLADFEEMLPDKPSDEKWELIGGRVIRMMVGARWEHHASSQRRPRSAGASARQADALPEFSRDFLA